ncbi:MAG: transglycosylase SLT domain-containing protein [Campylobacterota bacterium]|nr:transglycosylase SLT domain-containing protein [Campylobacterota bacterium]
MITKFLFFATISFIFLGCTQKSVEQIFFEKGLKYNVNHKTLYAICKVESNHNENVVNVNKSIFNIQQGPHYFNSAFKANLYMDYILDPLLLNYDIGICQINKQHLDRLDLDNEDLLDRELNIDTAAKIYKYNLGKCNNEIVCALSMYNTGYKNSTVGRRYAQKVLRIRKKLNY